MMPAEPPKPTVRDVARSVIDQMTLEQKVAQLFIVTPEQLTGTEQVLEVDDVLRESLQRMPVCGITYFDANLVNAGQTRELLAGTEAAAADFGITPLFLCVDEEGGIVQRIGGKRGFDAPFVGNARDIGATGDAELAANTARGIAQALLDIGFNVDFAPSCDIAPNANSSMHLRSFGSDANLVASMATAQIEAFQEAGMLCCAKHFPGLGDPEEDSHESSIVSMRTREELADQLIPFESAIAAGVPFVMVGHLSLPAITGSAIPASISPGIVQGILRDDLGYDGVVITDSLGMGALRAFCEPADVGVAAIEAGCDIALMPPEFEAAYAGLLDAVTSERISMERIDQSLERILVLKLRSFPIRFDETVQEELAACA